MFSANSSQVSSDRLYVEDVFSTYLYTGNGSTQTITNGIDLSGKGGMVWIKSRSNSTNHMINDTARGANKQLYPNLTNNEGGNTSRLTAFNSNGFNLSYISTDTICNENGYTYASWTFRKAPKFFDVVTYTGNGSSNQTISHNLGIAPGCIIVKRTDSANGWIVYHRGTSVPNNTYLTLQTTNAATNLGADRWSVTSTSFNANDSDLGLNASGGTYVAYLFAHDTTSDGIIQCGSFNTDGSETSVNLGWEPQWVMFKRSSGTGAWLMNDNMREWPIDGSSSFLEANTSGAEFSQSSRCHPTNTGFKVNNQLLGDYIYIAIRRGPMRTPTSGTSVFSPVARTGTGSVTTVNAGFAPDLHISFDRNANAYPAFYDRLRGVFKSLKSNSTAAEVSDTTSLAAFNNTNSEVWNDTTNGSINFSGWNYANWIFRRAPSFFDEVCYTGTGSAGAKNHNLGVVPELYIIKRRNSTASWVVGGSILPSSVDNFLLLNSTSALDTVSNAWQTPTSSTIGIGSALANDPGVNASGSTYVAYLFASAPGVSKVGSYTGNGSSQTINCGFAAGARFVMIKRTDSTGDWYVWDTARGIVSGNDPHLSLNSTAAEVTTDDSVDTDSSGFVVNQLSATNINVNAATYLYMAVA